MSMDMTSTERAMGPNSAFSGESIFKKDVRPSSRPRNSTIKDTITPQRYSILAWPKGCSRSAGFSESRKPTSMMIEDPESVRLFTASAIIATLPERSPAKSFITNSSMFVPMPTAPARLPWRSLDISFIAVYSPQGCQCLLSAGSPLKSASSPTRSPSPQRLSLRTR